MGLDRRSLQLVAVGGFLMVPFALLIGPALYWPDAFRSDEINALGMMLALSIFAAVLGALYVLGAGAGAVRRGVWRRLSGRRERKV